MDQQPQEVRTGDIGLAAYVMTRGLELLSIRANKKGKPVMYFADKDCLFDKLNVSYQNSQEKRYDDAIRGLKKAISRIGTRVI